MERQLIIYHMPSGKEPYSEFVGSLRDRQGAAKIKARATQAGLGNLGDHRTVGHGVVELKINFGPGYRVYIGLRGAQAIVLLGAGDKSSQSKDIIQAHDAWADYLENL